MIRIAECPEHFLPKMPVVYPPHQGYNPMIEERAYNFFSTKTDIESDYIYIPIQWTSYHINPHGEYAQNVKPLQEFCNSIVQKYPNEKFFTVVQYDGGTLTSIDRCLIFGSSGDFSSPKGIDSHYEPIPLLCEPHPVIGKDYRENKVGFAGIITHPIRQKMFDILNDLDGYEFFMNSYDPNRTIKFREILSNSVFALSPRGFGPASYRMYEAIQMQCIPIYISDEFWLPFKSEIEWEKMCLLINSDEIHSIPNKVDDILESGKYQEMIDYGQEIYQKYLTWDGCLNQIAKRVEKNVN
jgi:glycosyltransferase involved in cell wall biosynthesis